MRIFYKINRVKYGLLQLLTGLLILSLLSFEAKAQQIHVKGKVESISGEVLVGATIRVKNSTKGTVTDDKGVFNLDGVSKQSTLIISMMGFTTKEAAASPDMRIQLNEDAVGLQDVVVTGFQQIDKDKFTGSAVTLKSEDVKLDGLMDVSRMLEGRAAGVSIQSVSGTFGTAPKIRIRGATSLNGANKPLWVVDGVVLEDIVNISNDQLSSGDPTTLLGSAVAGLNPNDIETFDILKDAAAAALYGARAMNGVIVITTKKGKSGKPVISYSGNFSTQQKPSYRNFNIMNSAQQISVLGELERKGFLNTDIMSKAEFGIYGKYYDLIDGDSQGNFPVENSVEGKRNFLLRYGNANTDWFDLLFKQNFIQEHSLSVSFGTEKSQSYFSTSFLNDNGWTIADKVKRYTLNFRNNYQVNDRLSFGFSTLASVRNQLAPGSLERRSNPVEGKFDRDFDINPFSYALNTSRTMTAYDQNGDLEYFRMNYAPFNILSELDNNKILLNMADIRLQGELSLKLTKNITYDFLGVMRYVQTGREHKITENSNMANAYRAADNATIAVNNKFLYRNPDDPDAHPVVVLPRGGFYNRNEDLMKFYNIRNNLRYSQKFNEIHQVDALIGQEIKYTDRQNSNNTGYGFQYDQGGAPFVDYRILKQTIESNFIYYGMRENYSRFAAFYGSLGYTLNDKYNFTAYMRYDGSNGLGKSRVARWLPTYTIAASWNLDRENFIKNLDWISMARIRGSYGLSGDTGPSTNASVLIKNIVTRRPFADDKESALQLESLENTLLTWEKLKSANLGIDIGVFANRFSLSADIYSRKSFDLIDEIRTSGIGGQFSKIGNYADMESQGVDFSLSGTLLKYPKFSWRSTINFGYAQTRITKIENSPNIFNLVKAEGANVRKRPVRSLFSIDLNAIDPKTGVPVFINEDGEVSSNVYLQDQNLSYLKFEGPVDPPFTGGFNNTFNYKNLSLNILVTAQAGNSIRLNPLFKNSFSDRDAMPKEFMDRWVIPGDEDVSRVPTISDKLFQRYLAGQYPYNVYNYTHERVAKGDFIRLKSISLAYQIPKITLDKLGLTAASIQISTTNPFLIYSDKKLKGQDPEFFNSGGVAQPIQKQYTVALKFTL